MKTPFDYPIIRINYHDGFVIEGLIVAARAIIVVSNESGFAVEEETPRELPVTDIPVFLFQLVERGYSVSEDTNYRDKETNIIGARSILAVNRVGMDGLAVRFGKPIFDKQSG